jgi:methyl-accepting chemotaxis protein
MRLNARILIPGAISLVATVLVGTVAVVATQRIGDQIDASTHGELAAYTGSLQLKSGLGELQAYAYRQVTLANSLSAEQVRKARETIQAQVKQRRDDLQSLARGAQDGVRTQATTAILADLDRYAKLVDEAVDMATVDPNTGIASMQGADEIFHRNSASIDALLKTEDVSLQEAWASIARTRARVLAIAIVLTLAAAAATALLTLSTVRSLSRDIGACTLVADRVARGELATVQAHAGTAEMGELLASLQRMQASLREVVGEVRAGVEAMNTATQEIAQGNDDLSRRTEHQASNLEATAGSMAKMAEAVERNAASTREANSLVRAGLDIASQGGTLVREVVEQMGEIQTSSEKIAEIISVIDGIAFQTNILALNAAVEAARAGEQGRGFAVVAGEVRNLAQRSAVAAREIKDLITQSVDKVTSGNRRVNDAGATMTEIVAWIGKVANLIGEISAATEVQNGDVAQVTGAVDQLDSLTRQNAALAEQSAAAAQSLHHQAGRLSGAVAVFRTEALEA